MSDAIRLWAPVAQRVELQRGDRVDAMTREASGWWTGPAVASGEDYAFVVDGGKPQPDPRSRWQPQGVHGPTRHVTSADLAPVTPFRAVPLRDAVIYELHVGTFSAEGVLLSAVPHLDHLVELGVTHVEVMPLAQFPGKHGWGYDGVGLYATHAAYGGPHALRRFIEACHERGLAVILDVVHNHFGPEGAYFPALAPYRTERYATPWGPAINLDQADADHVRRFLIDSALGWLRDFGADGLRLDAVHSLRDASERHFIAELASEVRALEQSLDKPLLLIGEYDEHDPRAITPLDAGGWGLDAHWNDDFHHAVHCLVTGERTGYYQDFAEAGTLARVLEQGYALDGRYSPFRGTVHGKPLGEHPRHRLVAYIQSHDQIGNRATGDRLASLAGFGRAQIAAAILFASPFVPMLFQGEEWAASSPFLYFADFSDEALRTAMRDGRRAEHAATGWTAAPPDPFDPETRRACVLPWAERTTGTHAVMLDWYRTLIALRRAEPALRDGSPSSTRVAEGGGVLRIERGPLTLVCNLSSEPVPHPDGDVVLASNPTPSTTLAPNACVFVRR